jgi:hypothetical protein
MRDMLAEKEVEIKVRQYIICTKAKDDIKDTDFNGLIRKTETIDNLLKMK